MKRIKDLKPGDTAYDLRFGEVKIIKIKNPSVCTDYPFLAEKKDSGELLSYTIEGKSHRSHNYPLLHASNPFLAVQGKWMMVSDKPITEQNKGVRRFVFTEKCGKFISWSCAVTDKELETEWITTYWNYAKEVAEVEEILEYTMNELVAILGHNFKIKK